MMRGELSRTEMYAIGLHKMKCWKCNETFAALLLEFEEQMLQEVAETDPQLLEAGEESDEEPAFAAAPEEAPFTWPAGSPGRQPCWLEELLLAAADQ